MIHIMIMKNNNGMGFADGFIADNVVDGFIVEKIHEFSLHIILLTSTK